MGGKGVDLPWISIFENMINNGKDRDSTVFAFCKFTADMKSTYDSTHCSSWAEFLTAKEKVLAEQERELQTKIEVQQHARARVLRDLEVIDGLVEGLKKEKKDVRISRDFVTAAIRCVTNDEFACQLGTLSDDTTEEVEKLRSAIWVLQTDTLKEDAVAKGIQQLEEYSMQMWTKPWNPEVVPLWLDIITSIATRISKDLPSLQTAQMRLLTLFARRAANNSTSPSDPDTTVLDAFMQCNGLQKLAGLLKSINNDVKATTCMCVMELCVNSKSKDAFCLAGGTESLLTILEMSKNEAVLRYALRALWNQALNHTNKEVIRSKNGIGTVLHLLTVDSDEVVENACIALGYLTLDVGNMDNLKASNGIAALIATMRHPNHTIQCHAAGGLWHCAANDTDNRASIRELGGIAALIDLLRSNHIDVAENAAGALWNCVVDEMNTKAVHSLGGLQPLIQLLTSDHASLIENACGALSKCCELHAGTRAAVRKLEGLSTLVTLLRSPSPNVVCHAATALKNCARNDLCKVALVEIGGIGELIQLISSPNCSQDAQEDMLSALLTCSIKDPAKDAIRDADGLPVLLTCLSSPVNLIREKAMATLRNCSTISDNRTSLLKLECMPQVVSLFQCNNNSSASSSSSSSSTTHVMTLELREYAVATLWNLAWDDYVKQTTMEDGTLQLLVDMLDIQYGEAVVENAAGAVHSLTLHVPNREHVRILGGIQRLVSLLDSANEFVLENTLGALKNCTTNNPENQTLLRTLHALETLVELLACTSETVVREAGWCLKNLATDDANSELIGKLNGVQAFLQIAQDTRTSDNTRKVAILALQTLSKNQHNRALMQTLSQQPPQKHQNTNQTGNSVGSGKSPNIENSHLQPHTTHPQQQQQQQTITNANSNCNMNNIQSSHIQHVTGVGTGSKQGRGVNCTTPEENESCEPQHQHTITHQQNGGGMQPQQHQQQPNSQHANTVANEYMYNQQQQDCLYEQSTTSMQQHNNGNNGMAIQEQTTTHTHIEEESFSYTSTTTAAQANTHHTCQQGSNGGHSNNIASSGDLPSMTTAMQSKVDNNILHQCDVGGFSTTSQPRPTQQQQQQQQQQRQFTHATSVLLSNNNSGQQHQRPADFSS